MTLIDKAEALAKCNTIAEEARSYGMPQMAMGAFACMEAIAALPARGVGVKPEAAETLAKEMQAIVAADRWKGRDLSAAPPEKWSHLRPETQQFWIDTATRILAALEPALAPTDAAQAREAAARLLLDMLHMRNGAHEGVTKDDAQAMWEAASTRGGYAAVDAFLRSIIKESRT